MKEISDFRRWLEDMWLNNCGEHEVFSEKPYTWQEYWHRNKWWLRREFQYQQQRRIRDERLQNIPPQLGS